MNLRVNRAPKFIGTSTEIFYIKWNEKASKCNLKPQDMLCWLINPVMSSFLLLAPLVAVLMWFTCVSLSSLPLFVLSCVQLPQSLNSPRGPRPHAGFFCTVTSYSFVVPCRTVSKSFLVNKFCQNLFKHVWVLPQIPPLWQITLMINCIKHFSSIEWLINLISMLTLQPQSKSNNETIES